MWNRTKRTGDKGAGVLVLILLLFAPGWLYGQSLSGSNTQQAIIKPTKPRGPGALAPNPKPPEPPKIDSYQVTPPKPDEDDKPPRSGESTKPEKPDTEAPDEASTPGSTAEDTDDGHRSVTQQPEKSGAPSSTPDAVESTPEPSLGAAKIKKRAKAMQSRLLDAPRATFSLQQAQTEASPTQITKTEFEPGQVLFSVSGINEAKRIQNILASEGYRVRSRRVFHQLDMTLLNLRIPDGTVATQAVMELEARFPESIVELNHRYSLLGTENQKVYAGKLIGWQPDYLRCLAGMRIGMIDTAIAKDHPALLNSKLEPASVLVSGTQSAPGDHGTAVAAILASTGSDGFAIGVASTASLVTVEAFRETPQGQINTTAELIIAALELLLNKKVTVVNLSFGGPQNKLMAAALGTVIARNIFVVAAAGNRKSAKAVYPAAYDGVIAVTAVDANGNQMKDITQAGYIDFAAPGVDVWTAAANGRGKYVSGTSFAVPYVTALVSSLQQQHPDLDVKKLYQEMRQFASDLGEQGRDNRSGWGLISWPGNCAQTG